MSGPSKAVLQARQNAPSRSDDDEICPICKSSRYLNPNMRFLVNPECYHKMCESCVDRIFSLGPAQCPVVGCEKTLRKAKFRKQTFEDITVEREVDVRRRVAKIFNKREEDFPSLLEFNNYLEEVEDITFNLINQVDVEETEAKLAQYESSNRSTIMQNAARHAQEQLALSARMEYEREHQRKLREAMIADMEAEKREKAETKAAILKALETGDEDAARIIRKSQKVALKKSSMRRENQEKLAMEVAAARKVPTYNFMANLNKKEEEDEEKPFDPLDGLEDTNSYFTYKARYENPWLEKAYNDKATQAGGYFVDQYCQRAVFEAFSGVGCFIEDTPMEDENRPEVPVIEVT